ncbi:lipase family protein [Streptomyces mobaraensis NBRC 13819 = DSM 40847]|uniref:Lipase family protein n=2 Tax=Streptomyces mobaraensis TaxID=35621 RepID=A0A5N5W9U2_STRMB|nr:lipase family protein [Streptomyces mobaraensis]EMF01495.1 Lipase [Streptomyces mobaraensis NBRC 13819 = DSM 40847]KAB7847224.1 lipase family protein [Streptomyces mobaraensis]QTT76821.1 lipase family protein [Streptomyces mobaraensis NBRC 13819 = DSM 40847]
MSVPSTIDHKTRGYSLAQAYCLAQASDLAYKDKGAIEKQARDWGFDTVRHHETRFTPPFPLEDTQAYTMAGDDMVIVAFRGTEPAKIKDWLSDATTPPRPGPARTGYVHYGFAEALESIYPEIKDTLQEVRTDGQTLWFTGHSLGGALAMLAGARMYLEDPKLLADGVYTYGQPRTCDRILAMACNKGFKQRLYRFVNNNDIVPQLPPEPAYTHVETLRYIDVDGRIRESMSFFGGLADKAKGLTADAFAPASDGIRDHSIHRYLAALEQNLR